MSFGFGVGDFLAVGKLVNTLWQACDSAPGEFQELQRELDSIRTVIYTLQSLARDPTSPLNRHGEKKEDWIRLRENLKATLLELKVLLGRYEGMESNVWRRIQLGLENLGDLRGKLSFHLLAINTFVATLTLAELGTRNQLSAQKNGNDSDALSASPKLLSPPPYFTTVSKNADYLNSLSPSQRRAIRGKSTEIIEEENNGESAASQGRDLVVEADLYGSGTIPISRKMRKLWNEDDSSHQTSSHVGANENHVEDEYVASSRGAKRDRK